MATKKTQNYKALLSKTNEDTKSSNPETLVQNLINAKTAVKQAELNLQTAQEDYNELKEMYNFLEETKKELFD